MPTSVDDHLARALSLVCATSMRSVTLEEAVGSVLAEDVRAPDSLPAFDNSAMDGFAVRHPDLGPGTVRLPLAAEVAAGPSLPPPAAPGTAVPVMTGAPLPAGCDTVVPVEHATRYGETVLLPPVAAPGAHVRRRGEEHHAGEVLLGRGLRLRPVDVASLAAAGVAQVPVHRRPRVVVVGTGSELVVPGHERTPGGVHDANTTLLTTLVRVFGAEVTALPPPSDEPRALAALLLEAAPGHDLVITAGGISAGTHEVVRQALEPRGVEIGRVAMSPGAPQGLGRVAGTPLLALPGNPSAALVSCLVFVRPVVRALAGVPEPTKGWRRVVTGTSMTRRHDRTRFVPVTIERHPGGEVAQECGNAHQLGSFAASDAVVRIDAGSTPLEPGAHLPALTL